MICHTLANIFISKEIAMVPAVTVVIPTYNHAHFLVKALKSVIDQTFLSWEVIVINNFSKDETEQVVESFKDPRIKLINFSNNGVIAASRNKGIELAQGEFVAFLDSDDSWDTNKLERCISAFKNHHADIVSHHLNKSINGELSGILKNGPEKKTKFSYLVLQGNCLTNSSVVVRKKCLEAVNRINEDPDFITVEDYDLWIKLAQKNFKFHIIDEVLGEYYIHPNNHSSAIERHTKALLKLTTFYFSQISCRCKNRKMRKRIGVILYGAGRQASTQRLHKESIKYFMNSIKLHPFHYKTYIGLIILAASVIRPK
jgi:glycosyltransferase involved in cell wall biosynthesis